MVCVAILVLPRMGVFDGDIKVCGMNLFCG